MPDKKTNMELDKAFWDTKPASSTDCTGLVQGLPEDGSLDAYANMYNIPKQEGKANKQKDKGNTRP